MRIFLLCLLVLGSFSPAFGAEKTPDILKDLEITPRLGEQVPLALEFRDENAKAVKLQQYFDGHKPVLLVMSYYGCPMLCGIILNAVRDVLDLLDWIPGQQYRVVAVSFDPKEEPPLAAAKKQNIIESMQSSARKDAFLQNWHFLTGSGANSKALADAVGFRYKWVEEEKQFAHGAAIFFLSPEGKLTRAIFGTTYQARDVKLALLEASQGKVGTIAEKILLFCYHYDPKDNQYALFATRLMRLGGAITVAAFLAIYAVMYRRRKLKRG